MQQSQEALAAELTARGVQPHRFVRCPPDYYKRDLEYRRGCLDAASREHLCKSIVLESTRFPADITDCSDPFASRFILVIIQYAAKLHPTKLKNLMLGRNREAGSRQLSAKAWHYRLAPEEVSQRLTGYGHNSVTPICSVTPHMPLVLSHRVAQLGPDGALMWLGAGQVDLKVGFPPASFVAAYRPIVADITYDEAERE